MDVSEEEIECSTGHLHVGILRGGEVSAMEKGGPGQNTSIPYSYYILLRADKPWLFIL